MVFGKAEQLCTLSEDMYAVGTPLYNYLVPPGLIEGSISTFKQNWGTQKHKYTDIQIHRHTNIQTHTYMAVFVEGLPQLNIEY